jgi:sugar/nucleoside kinase (ribokinase family)
MNSLRTSPKEFDVAVVGEINADLILNGNVVPAFGQVEQIVDSADLVMGSSAVIFACGTSRLGLRTVFIGKVGDDFFGEFMLDSMQKRGVDVSGVTMDREIGTGLSVILATGGDRAILTNPGCIPELRYEDIDFHLLTKCRHLHLSSFFLLDKLRPDIPRLFRKAKEMGLSVSLDTNYDPAELWNGELDKALDYVDILLPNEIEAKAISGEKTINKALDSLSDRVHLVAIKLGEDGTMSKSENQTEIRQNAASVDVVDTVGAGDSFDAGYVYGFLNGWEIKKTLRLAVACGSISTLKPGGTTGQANLDEALTFIDKKLKK